MSADHTGLMQLFADASTSGDKAAIRAALLRHLGPEGLASKLAELLNDHTVPPNVQAALLKTAAEWISEEDDHSVRLSTMELEDVMGLAKHLLRDMLPEKCPGCGLSLYDHILQAAVPAEVAGDS